jgi:hypothetical protein
MAVLRRENFDGPADLGEGFKLHKLRNGRKLEAVCWLRSHEFGFELLLTIDGNFQRTEVCRSTDEALNKTESWRAALVDRGWK